MGEKLIVTILTHTHTRIYIYIYIYKGLVDLVQGCSRLVWRKLQTQRRRRFEGRRWVSDELFKESTKSQKSKQTISFQVSEAGDFNFLTKFVGMKNQISRLRRLLLLIRLRNTDDHLTIDLLLPNVASR